MKKKTLPAEILENVLPLLKSRRVWAGMVGIVGFLASMDGVAMAYDTSTLTELLLGVGQGLYILIPAILALWSFLRPSNN
jgi:hypothetical protein